VEARAGQLLAGHEALDQLVALPALAQIARRCMRLRRLLRQLRFDVAIEAQG